jgi:7-cyano-7-deazaguanine synthase
LLEANYKVYALTFNYGQKHKKEIEFSKATIEHIKTLDIGKNLLEHKIVDISSINQLISNSSLTSPDIEVPEGHYEDKTMLVTVVPNRNMIFLSLAIGYAVSTGASIVSYAAHSGDHAIYPDCRPEFVKKMEEVAIIANYEPVHFHVPFINLDKTKILNIGYSLKNHVDYSLTWTCYKGLSDACGKCSSCVERLEAFSKIGKKDPLKYSD